MRFKKNSGRVTVVISYQPKRLADTSASFIDITRETKKEKSNKQICQETLQALKGLEKECTDIVQNSDLSAEKKLQALLIYQVTLISQVELMCSLELD